MERDILEPNEQEQYEAIKRRVTEKAVAGLTIAMGEVEAFHGKLDIAHETRMPTGSAAADDIGELLEESGRLLAGVSTEMERLLREQYDPRLLRVHLLTEELAEFMTAVGEGDEAKALDGLTDLLYVLLGTAVQFDWPLPEAFAEVQRSNMTKEKQPDDASSCRVRVKGPNYSPADVAGVLRRYRENGH